jgi:hypothetical protein
LHGGDDECIQNSDLKGSRRDTPWEIEVLMLGLHKSGSKRNRVQDWNTFEFCSVGLMEGFYAFCNGYPIMAVNFLTQLDNNTLL